jgi:peptidoglycan/LPS O-acetylase OafA/YrhL
MDRTSRIVIAMVFSLLYVGLYPMLTGHSIIYFYPYWSPTLAAAYVAGGILLQGWFCYNWGAPVRKRSVAAQVLMGFGYLVLTVVVSGGGPYQS